MAKNKKQKAQKAQNKPARGGAPRAARDPVAQILASLYGYGRHGAAQWRPDDIAWYAPAGSPGQDIDENLTVLRARARDLFMSSALLSSILLTLRDGVIGRGLRFASQVDADGAGLTDEAAAAWDRRTAALFDQWCESADINGNSFKDIVSSAYFASILSGDCFVVVSITDAGPRLRVIEGDCVRTPPDEEQNPLVKAGCVFSKSGRFLGVYVGGYVSDGIEAERAFRFVPSFSPARGGVLHIHSAFERPGQVRGIPIASRVLSALKQLDRYIDAEVIAAVIAAKLTIAVTHAEDGDSWQTSKNAPEAAPLALGNGTFVDLEHGADIRVINPARPFGGFGAFCTEISMQICAALGLPFEIVVKKFDSSYSASRAALLDAQRTYEIERARIVRTLAQPVFLCWLFWAVNTGAVLAPGFFDDARRRAAWSRCAFHGEAIPSLDPIKEAQAATARIDALISTHEKEALIAGENFDTILRKRTREESKMRAAGLIYDQNHRPIDDTIGAESEG